MMKKFLRMFFGLTLCLLLLPAKAFAVDEYPVWVNGEQFSSDNLEILCGSGTAEYDPSTNVITLTDAEINNYSKKGSYAAAIFTIEAGDITIVLNGTNTITLDDAGVYGIETVFDALTLTGNGSLAITTASSGGNDAIYTNEAGLTVDMDGNLLLHAGDCGCGAYVDRELIISGAGDIEIVSGYDGIWTEYDITISGDANLSVESLDTGINSAGSITKSGDGNLSIESVNAGLNSSGDGISLSGKGDITIDSEAYDGISVPYGSLSLSGSGNLTITAYLAGLQAGEDITISRNGNVQIESAAYAIISENGDITIDGSGDIKLTTSSTSGVLAGSGDVCFSGECDISIDSYSTGIEAAKNITISVSGNTEITAANQYALYSAIGNIEFSGSGDVTAAAENGWAMALNGGNLILSGSGKVTVTSENSHGVVIPNPTYGLKLEGTANPVTITAGSECFAVYNGTDAPTGGSCFENYIVEGAPDTTSVIYRLGTLTLKFDMCGHGTAIADQSVKYGKTAENPVDPKADGLEFKGWYKEKDCINKWDFEKDTVAVNTTLYAKWVNHDTHFDENNDHVCDICKEIISEHKGVLQKGLDSTCEKSGFKDYYKCNFCGKYFEDETCKVEIKDLAAWKAEGGKGYIPKLEPVEYKIIEGNDEKIESTALKDTLFVSNADFSKFVEVLVDGKVVAQQYYDAKSGSTEIILKNAYLKTLAEGEHTLTIASTDGSASTKFYISASKDPVPKTGDNINIVLWGTLTVSSFVVLIACIEELKKKKRA